MISKLSCKAYLREVALPQTRVGKPTPPLSVRLDLMFPVTVDLQGAWNTLEGLLDGSPVQVTIERIKEEK